MKKILISILAMMACFAGASAQDSDLASLTDAVYVQASSVPAGSQQTLSVRMKNSFDVQTIQFDLYLPEGVTIVGNDDDELMTASKARVKKYDFFNSSIQSDGALRLLAQATTNNIAAGDGEIATLGELHLQLERRISYAIYHILLFIIILGLIVMGIIHFLW